ncbi:MAG: hypothetical protein ChlgKO_02760 [Chlamydiales bacterium]
MKLLNITKDKIIGKDIKLNLFINLIPPSEIIVGTKPTRAPNCINEYVLGLINPVLTPS